MTIASQDFGWAIEVLEYYCHSQWIFFYNGVNGILRGIHGHGILSGMPCTRSLDELIMFIFVLEFL